MAAEEELDHDICHFQRERMELPRGRILDPDVEGVILNPDERMSILYKAARHADVSATVSVRKYFQHIYSLCKMARYHAEDGNVEKALMLYVRFTSIGVEHLPKHRDFAYYPIHLEKDRLDRYIEEAMDYIEGAQGVLYRVYIDQARQLLHDIKDREKGLARSRRKQMRRLLREQKRAKTGVVTKEMLCAGRTAGASADRSSAPETVLVPNDAVTKFLKVAVPNTNEKIQTFGILCGKYFRSRIVVTHVVIPEQDGSDSHVKPINLETVTAFQKQHSLVVIGWIHTHPTGGAFLSGLDLHIQHAYQNESPRAVAIVCATNAQQLATLTLTEQGMEEVVKCTKGGLPHSHEGHCFQDATHVKYSDAVSAQVVDLRKRNPPSETNKALMRTQADTERHLRAAAEGATCPPATAADSEERPPAKRPKLDPGQTAPAERAEQTVAGRPLSDTAPMEGSVASTTGTATKAPEVFVRPPSVEFVAEYLHQRKEEQRELRKEQMKAHKNEQKQAPLQERKNRVLKPSPLAASLPRPEPRTPHKQDTTAVQKPQQVTSLQVPTLSAAKSLSGPPHSVYLPTKCSNLPSNIPAHLPSNMSSHLSSNLPSSSNLSSQAAPSMPSNVASSLTPDFSSLFSSNLSSLLSNLSNNFAASSSLQSSLSSALNSSPNLTTNLSTLPPSTSAPFPPSLETILSSNLSSLQPNMSSPFSSSSSIPHPSAALHPTQQSVLPSHQPLGLSSLLTANQQSALHSLPQHTLSSLLPSNITSSFSSSSTSSNLTPALPMPLPLQPSGPHSLSLPSLGSLPVPGLTGLPSLSSLGLPTLPPLSEQLPVTPIILGNQIVTLDASGNIVFLPLPASGN